MAVDQNNKIIDLIFKPKLRWLWHLLFWFIVYPDTFLSLLGITPRFDSYFDPFLAILIDMLFIYFNIYILVPKLLMKNKYILYIIASLLTVIGIVLTQNFFWPEDIEEEYIVSMYSEEFFLNLVIFAVAAGIKVLKIGFKSRVDIDAIKNQQLESELSFLKNQVNPHFLFNTLNILYIQAKKKEDISEALMSFSDLLRYQIYETQNDTVSLQKEYEYIENYLMLEKKRRSKLDIKITNNITNQNIKIAPLLFLPLVENAVKYSQTSNDEASHIQLILDEKNGKMSFTIENSKGNVANIKTPDSGIGLTNVKKRLGLIYPDKHTLHVEDKNARFIAELKIDLS